MRRFAVLSVALAIAMLVWADSTQAQDQGQGQGRQGRGGQPGGRGGRGGQPGGRGGRGGGLDGLLQINEVKTEIDLTEDQGKEIADYVAGLEAPSFADFGNFQDMSDEERAEAMKKFQEAQAKRSADIRKKVEGTLAEPQMKRLNELFVQRAGVNGIASDPWIQGQLNLDDDQKAKLAELAPAFGRGGRQGGGGGGGRGAGRGNQQERNDAIMAVLTEEQKTKYEEMKGEAFEFPAGGRGRGGRGGAGRGGAGGGGGGGGF